VSATANHPAVFVSEIGAPASAVSASPRAAVPWYLWTGAAAVTCSSIGGAWDVSWHRSIGRDTFWTPAHMLIYLCGVLAGIIGFWLVYQCTFGKNPELRASSVSVLGLHAPLGVFVAGWGGLAMLTSAPFDNWWHNAYGLDVKIVSPPHTLLILGVRAVAVGMLFLILAALNRTGDSGLQPATKNQQPATSFRTLQLLFLYLAGLIVGGQMFFIMEYTWDINLHSASAYIALGIAVPMLFAMFWQSSRFRWAATTTAAVYSFLVIAEILILPLFPAQPKLGPVFFQVTHFVPSKFPILLLAPAFALDLFWQRTRAWKFWQIALVSGVLFMAVLVAVEWPFAKFLMSHLSANRFFGTGYFQFNSRAGGPDRMRRFFHPDSGMALYLGLLYATLYASISTWIGLMFGRWMRGVQR
jgi:hypothetical protein